MFEQVLDPVGGSLGLSALAAFVDREPLWKVHQSVFAVLALESEPVDPRL